MLMINKDLSWATIDTTTVTEWVNQPAFGGKMPDGVIAAVDDDNPLYEKIMSAPRFEPVLDGDGNLTDITVLEPLPPPLPTSEEQIQTAQQQLNEIDNKSIRPNRAVLRALALGKEPNESDIKYLSDLEEQAVDLREQIQQLSQN